MAPLLQIAGLSTEFVTPQGVLRAVDGVDLALDSGRVLGVVGESGCGKTVLALSILRLLPMPPGRISAGKILFDGRDLLSLSDEAMRDIRGRDISMIFQEPMTALNPVFQVGEQVGEVLRRHQGCSRKAAWEAAVEMLGRVRIPSPEKRARDYPHQLSGGMRQRVMIAIALACGPRLMLADEPTTALDVTIQAEILSLIRELQEAAGTAVLLITHDMGVVRETAHAVAVMYAGEVVEYALAQDLFSDPLHPYSVGLLASIPPVKAVHKQDRLPMIAGQVPERYGAVSGCRFRDRCPDVMPICREASADLFSMGGERTVRCWKYRHA